MNSRPHYGRYLLRWCAVWVLVTVTTRLPEWRERCKVLAPYEHKSFADVLLNGIASWSLMEAVFGVVWASLSWLLQWGASRWSSPAWAAVQVAVLEAFVLGAPLSVLSTLTENVSLNTRGPIITHDTPAVTISNHAMGIETAGILLAFPLVCLLAGYLSARDKAAPKPGAPGELPSNENDATVWPPSPQSAPPEEG